MKQLAPHLKSMAIGLDSENAINALATRKGFPFLQVVKEFDELLQVEDLHQLMIRFHLWHADQLSVCTENC